MADVPRSSPSFPGDIQHDFRDFMRDHRLDTLSDWQRKAADCDLRAARLLGVVTSDPIAVCLADDPFFDARTLWVVHDRMAAHWRACHLAGALRGNTFLTGPNDRALLACACAGLLFRSRRYLLDRVDIWYERSPEVLRLFPLAVVSNHVSGEQAVEAELFFTLADLYPVPGFVVPKPLGQGLP